MDALKGYLAQIEAWIAANPTDVVYGAVILAGFTLLSNLAGGRRTR